MSVGEGRMALGLLGKSAFGDEDDFASEVVVDLGSDCCGAGAGGVGGGTDGAGPGDLISCKTIKAITPRTKTPTSQFNAF